MSTLFTSIKTAEQSLNLLCQATLSSNAFKHKATVGSNFPKTLKCHVYVRLMLTSSLIAALKVKLTVFTGSLESLCCANTQQSCASACWKSSLTVVISLSPGWLFINWAFLLISLNLMVGGFGLRPVSWKPTTVLSLPDFMDGQWARGEAVNRGMILWSCSFNSSCDCTLPLSSPVMWRLRL